MVSSPVISFFSGLFEQSLSPFSPIPDNNTTADQWQVSSNTMADQWQVSNNTTADQWQVSSNTTADQWQVSNNITADQWQVFTSEGQNERITMASNLQLAVSLVIIVVASVVVVVLVALVNRRRVAGRHLGAATNWLAPPEPEPRNQEERIPGRRMTFSRS